MSKQKPRTSRTVMRCDLKDYASPLSPVPESPGPLSVSITDNLKATSQPENVPIAATTNSVLPIERRRRHLGDQSILDIQPRNEEECLKFVRKTPPQTQTFLVLPPPVKRKREEERQERQKRARADTQLSEIAPPPGLFKVHDCQESGSGVVGGLSVFVEETRRDASSSRTVLDDALPIDREIRPLPERSRRKKSPRN